MPDILTYDPRKDKTVKAGTYDPITRTFTRVVTTRHFMRLMQAYGLQEDVITRLSELGCVEIKLITPTAIWKSRFEDWVADDIKVADYGHGRQRFMPINRMIKVRPIHHDDPMGKSRGCGKEIGQ